MYYAASYAKDHINLDEPKVLRTSSVQNFMFSSSVFFHSQSQGNSFVACV